ncbi:hypothetical protein DRO61_03860 [Candidatus Bathyarchaeota archaeon]|nr:MAG: hypothetical protein DRO61_03860 [Candidatus Bathyarchaeota archaeon]
MKVYEVKMGGEYLDLIFRNKCKLSIPIEDISFLYDLPRDEMENFELLKGSKIYWPDLDEEIIVNNIKNKFFEDYKVHLIDQVMCEYLRTIERGSGYDTTYCGNRIYRKEKFRITTKFDEVTCKACIRSINSNLKPVGSRVCYNSNEIYKHVNSPDGTLWVHPIVRRVKE